jgi:glutaminase
MNVEQIEKILKDATGDPTSGPVAEWIPAMAEAVAHALAPAPATDEKRIVKASETR